MRTSGLVPPLRAITKPQRDSYLAFWLSLMAWMHFPSVSSELLMFPASFSLSPVLCVREHLSDPARSHSASLNTHTEVSPARPASAAHSLQNCEPDLLADAEDSGNADVIHAQDPDGEDAVAAEHRVGVTEAKQPQVETGRRRLLLTSCWTAGSGGWRRNSGSSSRSSSLCTPPPNCSPGPNAGLRDIANTVIKRRGEPQRLAAGCFDLETP